MNPRRRRIRRLVRATRRIHNRLLHTSEPTSRVWWDYSVGDVIRAGLHVRLMRDDWPPQ